MSSNDAALWVGTGHSVILRGTISSLHPPVRTASVRFSDGSEVDIDFDLLEQPEPEQLSREALMKLESLAYHKWSTLRDEADRAHAEYTRIADRLNNLKIAESTP